MPLNMFSFFRFSALLLLLSSWTYALGADSLPSVESFFKDAAVQSAQLSPHGHYVATIDMMPDGRRVLAVRDTADLRKLTVPAVSKVDRIESVRWINENRLSFAYKNVDTEFSGNLDEFAVDRDGSNLVHLISGSWGHEQENTHSFIKNHILTADYAFYRTLDDGSEDIIVVKYEFNSSDVYPQSSRLYRLNSKTRVLSELLDGPQPPNVRRWLLDFDGVPRIAVSQAKGRCISSYRAPGSAKWVEIGNFDCYDGTAFTPVFFDGSGTLYVRANYRGYDALFRYDLKTMKLASEPFVNIEGFDVDAGVAQDHVSKKILGIHFLHDAYSTVWLDPHWKEIQKKVDALLPSTNNTMSCGSDCMSTPAILVSSGSDRQPPQYFIYVLASGAITGLGEAHPEIKPAQMGLRDFYHYAARDGRKIPVYVTKPPGKLSGPLPAVILVHGGPSMRGTSLEWDDEAQFLASRGYLVIQPEYRGSTGYGFAHFKAGWKQWGRSMQDDLADAAQWAVQKGWADPKRIGIMGASYGGYATMMGLIKNPEIFRCGVEWAGVSDIDMMLNLAESDISQDALQYGSKILIGDPVADAAQFRESSPLLNAAKLTQALLMAHGARDRRVPVIHATRFRDAVGKTNPQVEWILYTDEGHGWRHENNRIDFWKHVEVFLDKNLKTAK